MYISTKINFEKSWNLNPHDFFLISFVFELNSHNIRIDFCEYCNCLQYWKLFYHFSLAPPLNFYRAIRNSFCDLKTFLSL